VIDALGEALLLEPDHCRGKTGHLYGRLFRDYQLRVERDVVSAELRHRAWAGRDSQRPLQKLTTLLPQ
jgi:hypothetical protein